MAEGGAETTDVKSLEPGQMIRPQMTTETAVSLVEKLYGFKVKSIKELESYDDKNYLVKVEDEHSNPHIAELWPHGFVLKVLNSLDSPKFHVDAEHDLQKLLKKHGFKCSQVVPNIYGEEKHLEKIYHTEKNSNKTGDGKVGYGEHIVRLLTFLPGVVLHTVPYRPKLLYDAGRYLGGMANVMETFSHEALRIHKTVWGLESVPDLGRFSSAVSDPANKELVDSVIKTFTDEVVPQYEHFKRGTIHGDFNEQNLLVQATPDQEAVKDGDKEYEVCGVIDFGDNQENYIVFDLGMAIMYMMVESHVIDPLEVGGHVLAGYTSQKQLNHYEFDALRVCVAGRFVQSLAMGAYSYSLEPWNEYLLTTAENGWPRLKKLWETPKDELYTKWRNIVQSYGNEKSLPI